MGGCSGGQKAANPLMKNVKGANATVKEGCQIAQHKCTRCHTVERLLTASPATPEAWRRYVRRMRLMPGASIPGAEEPKIVQCLVYRAFGAKGLEILEGQVH